MSVVSLLEQYNVSPVTGFLPEETQVMLPEVYAPWLFIAGNLSRLIKHQKLRERVDSMPVLSVDKMHSLTEQRRAYSILAFMAHAYVWSPPAPCDKLPAQISEPLITLSEKLGLPPVGTYAGLVLWNYRINPNPSSGWKDQDGNIDEISDFSALTTYTGAKGEEWFYCVSVGLEKSGGPCLLHGMNAIDAARKNNAKRVISNLNLLSQDIINMGKIMLKLYDHLTPEFFYNDLRPYLAGWKGMEKNGLPRGVFYGDETIARKYAGGSNGQSSLIQALDIMLNVEHKATGERVPPSPMGSSAATNATTNGNAPAQCPFKPSNESRNAYLMEMRQYMPREHREFLTMLEKHSITRQYVKSHESNKDLVAAYDNCIKELRDFRTRHIQVVMRYISLQSRKANTGVGLAQSKGDVGTGGTELMPFLKQTRDEVSDSACGDWARNIVQYKSYKK